MTWLLNMYVPSRDLSGRLDGDAIWTRDPQASGCIWFVTIRIDLYYRLASSFLWAWIPFLYRSQNEKGVSLDYIRNFS